MESDSQIKVPKQDNYEVAYREAAEKLSKANIDDIALRSGSSVIEKNNSKNLLMPFINDEILISHPDISISYNNLKDEVPFWLQILILHYLVHAKGSPLKGEQMTFKQIEGGLSYFPVFQKRAVKPLFDVFGEDLSNFINTGESIGGVKSEQGDFALTFKAFPKIELLYVLWEGDEEFPSEGNVIFDSSITDYLTSEDVAVLANMITVMMIKKWYSKK